MMPGGSVLAILMCMLAVLYVFGAAGRAHQKLFWHDEIGGLTIASLPPQQLWAGLLDGTDLNPPLFHLTLQWWHHLGGEGAIASRVPSMAGLAVACFAVGIFVGRSLGWLAGCTAALILLGTRAYEFAYEVRPYAFVLAFAALALVCWQGATRETHHRTWWLLGLLFCCAAALSTHYYAILLPGALGLGEIVRLIETRRPEWRLWAVVTASLAAWVPLLPLINAARSFSNGFYGSPSVRSVLQAYEYMLIDLTVPFTMFLGVSGLAPRAAASRRCPRRTPRAGSPT